MTSKLMTSKLMTSKLMASKLVTSKFVIGDKVNQAFSNHAEGTVVAIFRNMAGEPRYAIEMLGHRTIQIASESSLVAQRNPAP